jgi:hypothetical protein
MSGADHRPSSHTHPHTNRRDSREGTKQRIPAKLANEMTFPKRPCQDFFRRAVIVNNDAKTFCATTGRRDMTDLDWPMVGVYLVMLMGAVLLLSALSMRGTRLRLPNALSPSE